MGLSQGVTIHCGTSFANEQQVKCSLRHMGSEKMCKVKLNKGCKEVLQVQQLQREHMASAYLPSLPVRYIPPTPCSVQLSGATRPLRSDRK